METNNSILFFDKCRLCLHQLGITNISDDLAQEIFTFTGIMVKQSDNLPQKICTNCLEVIEKAKNLKKVAIENNELLCCLFGIKEEKIQMDSKGKEHTDPFTKDKSPTSERKSHDYHKIKRSASTSSNQSVKEHKKKKGISVRKDLLETPKVVRSTDVEEKKDEKPPKQKNTKRSDGQREDINARSSTGEEEKKEEKPPPRHKMIKKSDGQEEYICGVCNKHYNTWKKLYLHNRLHNKKLMCPLDACGKKFATKGDLEKHIRTHTGVKPYICDICDKGFSQQGTLKVHKETVHYCFTCT